MSEVVTFVGYRPPARYDQLPWTQAVIQEAATETGSYSTVDTVTLTPVDADPSDPVLRSFTTEHGTALGYWYRVLFRDATGDNSQPTTPIQNVAGSTGGTHAYATLAELQRVLQKPAPTAAETVAMQRDLDVAAREIDWDLSYDAATNPAPAPATAEYALLADVNLDRAVELWATHQRPFGAQQAGADMMPLVSPRDTWHRHHLRLNPLRTSFGVA